MARKKVMTKVVGVYTTPITVRACNFLISGQRFNYKHMTVGSSRHHDHSGMIHCAQLPIPVSGAHRVYCAEVNLLEEGGEDCWKQWRQVRERLVLFLVKTKNRQKKCQHDDNSSMQMIGVKVFEDFDDLMREEPEVMRQRAKLLSISPTL